MPADDTADRYPRPAPGPVRRGWGFLGAIPGAPALAGAPGGVDTPEERAHAGADARAGHPAGLALRGRAAGAAVR
ncbi:hypothetical protein ACWGBX_27460, partial [Streptomyces sp. NPDC055037]